MASQYELKLKATLDASSLNQQAQAIAGKFQTYSYQSPGGSVSMEMQKLNGTLSRLNAEIAKLNSGVSRNSAQGGFGQAGIPSGNLRRFARVMGVHQLGGVANSLAETSGDEDVMALTKAGTKVAGYAAAGMAFGGPWGALAGGALGAIESAIDRWTESLKRSQQEVERWNQTMQKGSQFRSRWDQTKEDVAYSGKLNSLVKDGDIASLSKLKTELESRQKQLRIELDYQAKLSKAGLADFDAIGKAESDFTKVTSRLEQVSDTIERMQKARDAEQAKSVLAAQRLEDARGMFAESAQLRNWMQKGDIGNIMQEMYAAASNAREATTAEDFQKYARSFSAYQNSAMGFYESEYGNKLATLQQLLTPMQAVSNFAARGFSMGENDENMSIEQNVQQAVRELEKILNQMYKINAASNSVIDNGLL